MISSGAAAVGDGGNGGGSSTGPAGGGLVASSLLGWKGHIGGGGVSLKALPGGDGSPWTLDEMVESFETDRFLSKWQGDGEAGEGSSSGGGGGGMAGGGGGRSSKGGRGGGGGAGSEGARVRAERERHVNLVQERVAQLKRAVEEGKLKPISQRLLQVGGGGGGESWAAFGLGRVGLT